MLTELIWVTGAKGGIGSTIFQVIKEAGYSVVGTDIEVDITDQAQIERFMEEYHPGIVINSAGLPYSDEWERQMAKVFQVNTLGAKNLAEGAAKFGAKIVHISTDDVFAGQTAEELTEFDITLPTTVYGKSKLAAEQFVKECNPDYLIVRSSWLYGINGDNFVKYILKQTQDVQILGVPNDQISTPTSAKDLTLFLLKLLENDQTGIFHASCEGACSRYDFAQTILKMTGITSMEVTPVLTSHTENKARCTLLKNLMMEITGIYKMPHWKDSLRQYLEAYTGEKCQY